MTLTLRIASPILSIAHLIGSPVMRVLIVEDDARVSRLLRTVLKRDGHEAVLAECGEDGWRELTEADPPLLLILDRMLPDMDGADLLARIRADARTRDLPVLMLTAAVRASRHLGDGRVTRVLAKPFDLADFRATCSALCPAGRPHGETPHGVTPHGENGTS